MDMSMSLGHKLLSSFLEPTFHRETVGQFSAHDADFKDDDSGKAQLVALKELRRPDQGIIDYDIPAHLEGQSLIDGYETYNDTFDEANSKHLISWIKRHKSLCSDVDIVCSAKIAEWVYMSPFSDDTSTPWEIQLARGIDGVCYLTTDDTQRDRYGDMITYGKQQYYRQRAFDRFMTLRKNDTNNHIPPSDHSRSLYKVNKLKLDSGVMLYSSEIPCYDRIQNALSIYVQEEGEFLLPAPSVRLGWWVRSHLSGMNTVICGYYDDEDLLLKISSFDLKYVKPRSVRNLPFDDEIGTAALHTFTDFVKELTADGSILCCTLRFEPGSKRICVLDVVKQDPALTPIFTTQISATDELSSVESTPRTPRLEQEKDQLPKIEEISAEFKESLIMPATYLPPTNLRLRRSNSTDKPRTVQRRNTLTTEAGNELATDSDDPDDIANKYKKRRKRRENDDTDFFSIMIVFLVIGVAMFGVPWALDAAKDYLMTPKR